MKFSKLISTYKVQLIFAIGLILGLVLIQSLIEKYSISRSNVDRVELDKSHSDALLRAQTSLNSYATIVSSIKAFINNSDPHPNGIEVQNYLNDILIDTDFTDSINISYLDTSHVFQYVITPNSIDPKKITGIHLSEIRPLSNLRKMDSLNKVPGIRLINPLNLVEGWTSLPFSFAVRNSSNILTGYLALNLSTNYLLRYINKANRDVAFQHSLFAEKDFQIINNAYLNKSVIHTENYSLSERFDDSKSMNLKSSTIKFNGIDFTIVTQQISTSNSINWIQTVIYSWYLLLTIISLIALLQYSRILTLKKNLLQSNSLISSKNSLLEARLERIEILNKEVHHRVKNNMQIISSLLNLQENNLDNPFAEEALREGKGRIQSMALVHQKLYDSKNLDQINSLAYLKELIRLIESSIVEKSIKVEKSFDIPKNHYLNADKMILIGLIINELATNSFKYAFNNFEESPHIYISIEETENSTELTYSDNGEGLNENLSGLNKGFGLELIKLLAQQIEAKLIYSNNDVSEFKFIINKKG